MNVNIWWQDLAGRSPPSDDSESEGRKSHKIFNNQKISGRIHFPKECNTNTSWDMKNDSDIYSGHKTLLKISIYQFNKTSSGVTEAEPPRDRYHEALVIVQQSRKQVMICWFYVIIGVILRVVMNEMSVYLVDHTQHHTGDSRQWPTSIQVYWLLPTNSIPMSFPRFRSSNMAKKSLQTKHFISLCGTWFEMAFLCIFYYRGSKTPFCKRSQDSVKCLIAT